eukprot:COSAG02_NODE_2215_length_9489_cov_4.810011_8_plen_542_part_00
MLSTHRHRRKGTHSDEAQLSGAIGRLASVDAEVSKFMADTMAVASVEEILGPEEKVLAKLPCVGFDGFPDFATTNNQQRIGKCSVSLIGSEKDPHCPLRMLFCHHGQLRSIEASEEAYQLPLIFADSNNSSWTATREQSTAMAAIHVRSQLVGITSDNVAKVALHKTRGYNKPWWIGTIFTLIVIGILFWFKTFIGAALDSWYPPLDENNEEWVRGCTAEDIAPSWKNQVPPNPLPDGWMPNNELKIKCYNPRANLDDGSCIYTEGCTDPDASNYQPNANKDDGSCEANDEPPPPPPKEDETEPDEVDDEDEESECPDSPKWTGDQYIWFFAWVIKIPLFILALVFVFKRGWTKQVSFHAAEEESEARLTDTISKTETFKTDTGDSFTTDIWEATLFSSRFQGVNICVADPYNDEAREVVCVIDSTVPTRDIGRFILMADAAKMDRSSKDSRNIKFLGGNRRLRRSAAGQKSLTDGLTGKNGLKAQLRKFVPLVLFILGCWFAYVFLETIHGHAGATATTAVPPTPTAAPSMPYPYPGGGG